MCAGNSAIPQNTGDWLQSHQYLRKGTGLTAIIIEAKMSRNIRDEVLATCSGT
jgi:hypothetical protein